MPGFKPRAELAFRDIRIAIIRLTNASETQQQHAVIRNLLNGLNQIEPLWTTTTIEPKPKSRRTLPSEREQRYEEFQQAEREKRIAAELPPVPVASREDRLRWHEADPTNFPYPADD